MVNAADVWLRLEGSDGLLAHAADSSPAIGTHV
jgi:hypothetical protein